MRILEDDDDGHDANEKGDNDNDDDDDLENTRQRKEIIIRTIMRITTEGANFSSTSIDVFVRGIRVA